MLSRPGGQEFSSGDIGLLPRRKSSNVMRPHCFSSLRKGAVVRSNFRGVR